MMMHDDIIWYLWWYNTPFKASLWGSTLLYLILAPWYHDTKPTSRVTILIEASQKSNMIPSNMEGPYWRAKNLIKEPQILHVSFDIFCIFSRLCSSFISFNLKLGEVDWTLTIFIFQWIKISRWGASIWKFGGPKQKSWKSGVKVTGPIQTQLSSMRSTPRPRLLIYESDRICIVK